MRRLTLLAIIGGLAAIAAVTFGVYLYQRPSVLRVAVTRDSDDQAILAAAAQEFVQHREPVRLKVVVFDTLAECARAFDENRVDLAVVRSDISMPTSGQTVLIMPRNAVFLFAAAQSGVRSVDDLRGRKVGVLQGGQGESAGNQALLDAALAQYDVSSASVKRQNLSFEELAGALRRREIDAVLAVEPLGSESLTQAVATLSQSGRGQPIFVPITEAKAISQRRSNLEAIEIVRGVFGGAQPKPAASYETLGVSTRLIAQHSLSNETVGALTELLLSSRPTIASRVSMANRIEAPGTDKGAALPVHPGVLAYLNDEEQTLFEKYGDVFYIGAMALSLLGTALAAVATRFSRRQSADIENILQRLLEIVKAARCVEHADALDEIEREADELLALALAGDCGKEISVYRLTATNLALNQVRHAIAEKRQHLTSAGVRVPVPFAPRVVRD
jgi:TRAP transporter TAXI family solute receptor